MWSKSLALQKRKMTHKVRTRIKIRAKSKIKIPIKHRILRAA